MFFSNNSPDKHGHLRFLFLVLRNHSSVCDCADTLISCRCDHFVLPHFFLCECTAKKSLATASRLDEKNRSPPLEEV